MHEVSPSCSESLWSLPLFHMFTFPGAAEEEVKIKQPFSASIKMKHLLHLYNEQAPASTQLCSY